MKPKFAPVRFHHLPKEVQDTFVAYWRDQLRPTGGWTHILSNGYEYIMNRQDQWFFAKHG